jgi:hypothetical protein
VFAIERCPLYRGSIPEKNRSVGLQTVHFERFYCIVIVFARLVLSRNSSYKVNFRFTKIVSELIIVEKLSQVRSRGDFQV